MVYSLINPAYLGGPPLTSHLNWPPVSRLTLLRRMLVGVERSDTVIPATRKMVKGGESVKFEETIEKCVVTSLQS